MLANLSLGVPLAALVGGAAAIVGATFALMFKDSFAGLLLTAIFGCGLGSATFAWLSPLSHAAKRIRSGNPEPVIGRFTKGSDDVTVVLRALEEHAATVQSLTHRRNQVHAVSGLPTREPLLAAIESDIERGTDYGLVACIQWADYDRVAGFDSAAAVGFLAAFARRLRSVVAKNRPLAQIGHDCFAIWFSDGSAATAASELRAIGYALTDDLQTDKGMLVPEVRLSAANYPQDEQTGEALLLRARVARAAFEEFEGEVKLRTEFTAISLASDFALEQQLRRAIERSELELHYQPVIDTNIGGLVGAEALLRWTSADHGPVPPARFIPMMERIGLADDIGTWVFHRACRDAAHWNKNALPGIKVAVNVSHKQIANPRFERAISSTLQRYGLDPKLVELELTESAATHDIERTKQFFAAMRRLGVRIAIDDFGTGYSSLSYLKQLRFDKLKIDREFVTDIDTRADSQAICQSLIALARGLGIAVLAEGTERIAEVTHLERMGCPLFQGYYFSKPLPIQAFVAYARQRDWAGRLSLVNSATPSERRLSA